MSVHGIIFALTLFLSFFDVSVSCVTTCADPPTFSTTELVVKYGDSAAVNCTVCTEACKGELFGLEYIVGSKTVVGTEILWTADNLTEWDLSLTCFYAKDSGEQCCRLLPFTLYKLPDQVSFSIQNHTGPLYEYQLYTLECHVKNVAPISKVEAVFYRGDYPFAQVRTTRKLGQEPLDFTFTIGIIPQRHEEGAVYRCAASIELGPEGPQPPPLVRSNNEIPTTVYYKAKLQEYQSSRVYITEGHQMELNCTSVGNPTPTYTWTLPSGEVSPSNRGTFTIKSVSSKDEGRYTCTVSNDRWSFTEEFFLEVIPDYASMAKLDSAPVVIGLVLLITVGLFIYCHFYKNKHTGRYNLLKIIRLRPTQPSGSQIVSGLKDHFSSNHPSADAVY